MRAMLRDQSGRDSLDLTETFRRVDEDFGVELVVQDQSWALDGLRTFGGSSLWLVMNVPGRRRKGGGRGQEAPLRFLTWRGSHLKFYGMPASELPFLIPRYNIAPSQNVPVIVERGAEREVALFQWGLIPSWSKEQKGFINARAETLEEKPSFSESFQRRRCSIPADGFFEWARRGRSKQPYYFQMKDESPFAFAGIWDKWQGDGVSINSCAIITTTPNELLSRIHDRMPVILNAEAQEEWLRVNAVPTELKELLVPFPGSEMKSFPVSSQVNHPQNDEARLVEPIEIGQEPTTGMLFDAQLQ